MTQSGGALDRSLVTCNTGYEDLHSAYSTCSFESEVSIVHKAAMTA